MSELEETNSMSKNSLTDSTGVQDTELLHKEEEPPKKKAKNSEIQSKKDNLYPFAKMRGIRIFSDREINGQGAEMTREYWKFWNCTAEELCSDDAYNDWGKRDLKLHIDAAWVVHKTHLQVVKEQAVRDGIKELQESLGTTELPAKLKMEDENVTELLTQLQDSTANLTELNVELGKTRGDFFSVKQRPCCPSYPQEKKDEDVQDMIKSIAEKEKNLYDGMADVKKDQDSMKKALTRLNNLIEKAKRNCSSNNVILEPALQTIEATIISM